MNKNLTTICCLLLFPIVAVAEIYKWVDKDGSVNFSDQAPNGRNVQKLDIKPTDITVMNQGQKPANSNNNSRALNEDGSKSKPANAQKYTSLNITYPTDNLAVRANDGSLKVLCNLKPALNTKKQHRIRFHIDGKPLTSIGTACEITLSALNRGTHSVAAEVLDKAGKPLLKSPTLKFHLKRTSAL